MADRHGTKPEAQQGLSGHSLQCQPLGDRSSGHVPPPSSHSAKDSPVGWLTDEVRTLPSLTFPGLCSVSDNQGSLSQSQSHVVFNPS